MPDTQDPSTLEDKLESIFTMQASLNDYVFRSNDVRDECGNPLAMHTIAKRLIQEGQLSVNDLPNQWLARFAKAMRAELEELEDELLWKWWSKDTIDLQNIRIELVDILHFLVSAMIAAGMTPESVHNIYRQKHAVNMARQDSGYSRETKTEDDNRSIQ